MPRAPAQTHRDISIDLGEFVFVVGDTRTPRGLVDSEYNARRAQVEKAAHLLDGGKGQILNLRDATPERLRAHEKEIGPLLFRRASHVVEENARTLEAARLFSSQKEEGSSRTTARSLGRLLDASHASLRDLFEVSSPELNALETSLRYQGDDLVPGARMMGGGFGGCVIALVKEASLTRVLARAGERYLAQTGSLFSRANSRRRSNRRGRRCGPCS